MGKEKKCSGRKKLKLVREKRERAREARRAVLSNFNHPVRSRSLSVARLREGVREKDRGKGREKAEVILTGAPLRVHVMLGAGREAPDVQFARSVSPADKCSLSTAILGSVSGTSAHHNNATLIPRQPLYTLVVSFFYL